jgi:two-component system sensor histidine kinase AlgZ
MNIIASLIHSEPDTAEQVVEDLSTLFRASLGNEGDLVPLTHELDLCERYIHIEQLRLGDRLHVNWHNMLQSNKHLVPSLCLQPLVENAIYHGIQPRVTGGVIDITLSDADQRLSVCISNPYDLYAPASRSGNGMALNNLEQRLLSRYGKAATFSLSQDQETFVVSFSLPCESAL